MNLNELGTWIQHRRWYAAKNVALQNLEIVSETELDVAGSNITHLVAAASSSLGRDLYQLWLHNDIEIFEDPDSLMLLLDAFKNELSSGAITFCKSGELAPATTARVITTEQSNSSVIFGDHVIAKFYRRITPGINPDLEIGRALDAQSCQYVPRIRGWVAGEIEGVPTTLAVMHEFFATAADGFEHALASVRDFIANELSPSQSGGDFAGEAERLGEAISGIHRDLEVAFGSDELLSDIFIDEMLQRLTKAVSEVPALLPLRERIALTYEQARGTTMRVQRIHGDLHLGQVLRDTSGWKVLDFEGEPGSSLAGRRQFGSTGRDIAGLLRSFDYASRQPLIGNPDAERILTRTSEWTARNRAAFLRGYGSKPDSTIFELDKAVYEAVYEHRFRPDWIGIPLGGILKLLEAR